MKSVIDTLSITADFWRTHLASLLCLVFLALSIVVGYFVFRPLSWRRFLDRCPLFLVTGGALSMMAIGDLPDAVPKLFAVYLGHSIYQMVYRQEGSGITVGELWINRWQERTSTVFEFLIAAATLWAILNLSRKRAARANMFALFVAFGWVCLMVWVAASHIM